MLSPTTSRAARTARMMNTCVSTQRASEADQTTDVAGRMRSTPERALCKPHKQLVGPGVWGSRVHHVLVELQDGALCHTKEEAMRREMVAEASLQHGCSLNFLCSSQPRYGDQMQCSTRALKLACHCTAKHSGSLPALTLPQLHTAARTSPRRSTSSKASCCSLASPTPFAQRPVCTTPDLRLDIAWSSPQEEGLAVAISLLNARLAHGRCTGASLTLLGQPFPVFLSAMLSPARDSALSASRQLLGRML